MSSIEEIELQSKITTLKKQNGTTLYPRSVTDAIVDKEGRILTDILSNLSVGKENHSTIIETMKERMDIIEIVVDSKVDAEEGKGLSSNDFTDELKAKLEGIDPSAVSNIGKLLDGKVDKVDGKELSSNDFTDDLKAKLMQLPTKAELDEMFSSAGGTVVEQIQNTMVTHEQKFDVIDETLVQNVVVEDNKIVFTTKNNTIVNELEFITKDDSAAILESIFNFMDK